MKSEKTVIFEENGNSVYRCKGGGYEFFFQSADGTLGRVVAPKGIPPEAFLAAGADGKPAPKKKKAVKKVAAVPPPEESGDAG